MMLAIDYMNAVEEKCAILFEGFGVKNKYELGKILRERINGEFFVNGKRYEAFMHGRGCDVYNGHIHIDWDFDDKSYGINPVMLCYYIKQVKPELYDVNTHSYIKDEFDKAVKNNELIKRHDLYYLKA